MLEREVSLANAVREAVPKFGIVTCPIIYYLIQNSIVVYIGQSQVGTKRIFDHVFLRDKNFDEYAYCEVARQNLDYFEATEICRLKPKYNRRIPSPRGTIGISYIRNILQNNDQWERFLAEVPILFQFRRTRLVEKKFAQAWLMKNGFTNLSF